MSECWLSHSKFFISHWTNFVHKIPSSSHLEFHLWVSGYIASDVLEDRVPDITVMANRFLSIPVTLSVMYDLCFIRIILGRNESILICLLSAVCITCNSKTKYYEINFIDTASTTPLIYWIFTSSTDDNIHGLVVANRISSPVMQ